MMRSGKVRLLLKTVVSAGLLAFLFSRISLADLQHLLGSMDVGLFAAAVGVFFMSNILGSVQWHILLLSSGVRLNFTQTFRFYFVGLFFNNFLPANIGGDAVKIYDVTRIGSNVYRVAAVTVLDRLIGIFSLCALAVAAVLVLSRWGAIPHGALYLVILLGCMAVPAMFYFIEPMSRVLRWLVGRAKTLSMDRRGASLLDCMGEFKDKKVLVLSLVWFSLAIQALRVLTHILVGMAIGVGATPIVVCLFFVFVPVLSLAMIPPVTINGLGIREGLGIVLFSQAGIGGTDAFALEFITYLVSLGVSLLGLVFFLARRGERLEPRVDFNPT